MVDPSDFCTVILSWYYYRDHLTGTGIIFISLMGLGLLPTTFLNILTLVTVWRKPSFHNPSGYFICNFALSDLAAGVFGIPVMITWMILDLTSDDLEIICTCGKLRAVGGAAVAGTSFLTLTAAVVDRYFALRYHLRYSSIVTTSRVIAVCIGCWLLALAASLTQFSSVYMFEVTALAFMAPSMVLIIVCYYKFYLIVRHHHNQIQAQVTEENVTMPNMSCYKKTVSVLVYLVIVFFFFYTPFVFILIYQKVKGYTLFYLHGWLISVALVYISSSLNPLIYCWRLKEFRIAMKETFWLVIMKQHFNNTSQER